MIELARDLAERVEGCKRHPRWLPLLHASPLAHAPEGQRAAPIVLSLEPLDGEVAELLDFIVPGDDLRQVRELNAYFGQLGRRGGIVNRELEVRARRGDRIEVLGFDGRLARVLVRQSRR